MVFAATKDALKKAFAGVQIEYQASDKGDLDYNEIRKLCTKDDKWRGDQEEAMLIQRENVTLFSCEDP